MNKHLTIAAGLISAALTGSAIAADMPLKAPPPVAVAAYSWTGCYIGGHLGAMWVHKDWDFVTTTATFPFGDQRGSGWVAGGQAGCNYQVDSWVFGIQGDYSATDTKLANPNVTLPFLFDRTNVRSLASVTGRVGRAWDRTLLYVKGGYAWERDRYSLDGNLAVQRGDLNIVGIAISYAGAETRGGWTIGGGMEYAFLNNWSFFGEYNYYDFGTRTVRFTDNFGLLGPIDIRIRERKSVAKIGINYKFGGAAVVAAAPVISK